MSRSSHQEADHDLSAMFAKAYGKSDAAELTRKGQIFAKMVIRYALHVAVPTIKEKSYPEDRSPEEYPPLYYREGRHCTSNAGIKDVLIQIDLDTSRQEASETPEKDWGLVSITNLSTGETIHPGLHFDPTTLHTRAWHAEHELLEEIASVLAATEK